LNRCVVNQSWTFAFNISCSYGGSDKINVLESCG